MALELIANLLY